MDRNQEENVEWYRNRRRSLKRTEPSADDGEIGKLPINCRCQSVFSRRKKSSLLRRVSNNARYNGDSIVDCASSTAIFLSSIICFSPTATMLSNESPCVLIYEITDFSTSHFARTIFHIIFQFTRLGIPLSLSLCLVSSTFATSEIQQILFFFQIKKSVHQGLLLSYFLFSCCFENRTMLHVGNEYVAFKYSGLRRVTLCPSRRFGWDFDN